MATNQTENYSLNQWELSDSVVMADFNADNQKVDAALAALNKRIDTAVADAEQRLNTIIDRVSATIPHVQTGSYVGTGTYGEENPNILTFDFTPKLVIVSQVMLIDRGNYYAQTCTRFVAVYGTEICFSDFEYTKYAQPANLNLAWGSNTLNWYSTSADAQGNVENFTYHYIAIG